MPPLLALLVVNRLGLLGRPARAPIQQMLDPHLDWLESELAGRDWFAGDEFTAADVMMSFPLEAARHRAGLDESRPNLIDWLERIHARPAYAEALQEGRPLCLCLSFGRRDFGLGLAAGAALCRAALAPARRRGAGAEADDRRRRADQPRPSGSRGSPRRSG